MIPTNARRAFKVSSYIADEDPLMAYLYCGEVLQDLGVIHKISLSNQSVEILNLSGRPAFEPLPLSNRNRNIVFLILGIAAIVLASVVVAYGQLRKPPSMIQKSQTR